MGVDIPKPNLPAAGQSHNPYSAKNRPQQTPKQEQSGGQQPWGN